MSGTLADVLLRHIRREHLFPESGRALVAVSGGPDSIALLALLVRLAPELELDLTLAHVNHGILPDSDRVAKQVSDLAKRLELPFQTDSLRLGSGVSETRAREHRYRSLAEMRLVSNSDYLVTAHHADDQVETVLLRFLNGSGLAGLAGMSNHNRSDIVRPLLPFHRNAIAEWAAADPLASDMLAFVHEDPSNRDPVHDRAWIRHEVLPRLRDRMGDRVDRAILRIAQNAAAERQAWSEVLKLLPDLGFQQNGKSVQVARTALQRYDPRLSISLLCSVAREAGCVLGPERARRLWLMITEASSGRTFQLGNGWVIETTFDQLLIHRSSSVETAQPSPSSVKWGDRSRGRVTYGGWLISWRPGVAATVRREGLETWVTGGAGTIRSPLSGDRMIPIGGVGRRKVSRLLMEGKVPRGERRAYPVLARGDHILWLPGICRSGDAVPALGDPAVRIDAWYDGD